MNAPFERSSSMQPTVHGLACASKHNLSQGCCLVKGFICCKCINQTLHLLASLAGKMTTLQRVTPHPPARARAQAARTGLSRCADRTTGLAAIMLDGHSATNPWQRAKGSFGRHSTPTTARGFPLPRAWGSPARPVCQEPAHAPARPTARQTRACARDILRMISRLGRSS